MSGLYFHGPKDVRDIIIRLYFQFICFFLSLPVIGTKEVDTSLKTEVDCRTGELLVELGGHKYPIDSEFSEDRRYCVKSDFSEDHRFCANSEFSEDRGYCVDVSQNIVSTGLCCYLNFFKRRVCAIH